MLCPGVGLRGGVCASPKLNHTRVRGKMERQSGVGVVGFPLQREGPFTLFRWIAKERGCCGGGGPPMPARGLLAANRLGGGSKGLMDLAIGFAGSRSKHRKLAGKTFLQMKRIPPPHSKKKKQATTSARKNRSPKRVHTNFEHGRRDLKERKLQGETNRPTATDQIRLKKDESKVREDDSETIKGRHSAPRRPRNR